MHCDDDDDDDDYGDDVNVVIVEVAVIHDVDEEVACWVDMDEVLLQEEVVTASMSGDADADPGGVAADDEDSY